MKWNHGYSWATGILTGIVISEHSILLVLAGGLGGYLFTKLGAGIRAINRRWTILS